MNVLLISSVFTPEPIVISTISEDLAVELSSKNNVTVLCPKPTRPYGYMHKNYDYNHKPYHRIELDSYTCAKSSFVGRFFESLSFGKAAYKFIKQNKDSIDKIYAWAWPLYGQQLIVKAAKKFGIPVIIHVQDVYPEPLLRRLPIFKEAMYKLFFPIDKYTLQNADHVITIAPKIAEYLISTRDLDKDKVSVVYNWQDDARFRNNENKYNETNKFTFLFLGTISAATNLGYVLDVFCRLKLPNTRFVIAGSGSYKSALVNIAKCLSVDNVEFIDAPSHKVAEIQSIADVLILSLKAGGGAHAFPSKLTAYMYSKKPILACVDETCDIGNAIREAKCGWVINPKNKEALTSCFVESSLKTQAELTNMGENGLKYCQSKLTRSKNLSKLVQIVEFDV